MKRYELNDDHWRGFNRYPATMDEHPEGDFVRHEDVVVLQEENKKLKEVLTSWTQIRTHTCASPEFMELMRGSLAVLKDNPDE